MTPEELREAITAAMMKQQAAKQQYGFGPMAKGMQGLGEGLAAGPLAPLMKQFQPVVDQARAGFKASPLGQLVDSLTPQQPGAAPTTAPAAAPAMPQAAPTFAPPPQQQAEPWMPPASWEN